MAPYTARKQERTKQDNNNKIISALSSNPKRFKDLEISLEMSQTTLTARLKELEGKGIIEKSIHQGNTAYQLTRKGRQAYDKIMFLIDRLVDIWDRDGNYISGGTPVQPTDMEPLFWPAMTHLAADKTISNVPSMIPKHYLFNLQSIVISDILKFISKQNLKLDENEKGNIVLAIEIDHQDLARAIKHKSFAGWKKLWKKEDNVFAIFPQDSFTKDKKPYIIKYKYNETNLK